MLVSLSVLLRVLFCVSLVVSRVVRVSRLVSSGVVRLVSRVKFSIL